MTDPAILLLPFLFVGVLVTLALVLRFAEQRSPRFSAFLDRHMPEGEDWRAW